MVTPPYNNRVNLTALGRHAPCLRKGRAGDTPEPSFSGRPLRPCSLLIHALYGPKNIQEMKNEEIQRRLKWPSAWLIKPKYE
jgi:hypothetical protein